MAATLDLPLITEATNDYYRNIYADPDLGPIFKGVNMVVLRTHVSYFINQLTMFDTAMTPRQLEYLRRTHEPLIAKHGITQHHYDVMLQYLTEAMRTNGAQEDHLVMVQAKLLPLRNMFPPAQQSEDGHVEVHERCDQCAKPDGAAAAAGACSGDADSSKPSSSKPAWLQRVLKPFSRSAWGCAGGDGSQVAV